MARPRILGNNYANIPLLTTAPSSQSEQNPPHGVENGSRVLYGPLLNCSTHGKTRERRGERVLCRHMQSTLYPQLAIPSTEVCNLRETSKAHTWPTLLSAQMGSRVSRRALYPLIDNGERHKANEGVQESQRRWQWRDQRPPAKRSEPRGKSSRLGACMCVRIRVLEYSVRYYPGGLLQVDF